MPSRAAAGLGRASVLLDYSARHWLSGWWLNFRRLIFVVIVLAFMVALAGFVPAMRFQATAAYDNAGYAVRVNGLLTEANVAKLERQTGLAGASMSLVSTPVVAGGRTSTVDLYLGRKASDQSRIWFTKALRVSGRPVRSAGGDEIALDWISAKALRVGPGDRVSLVSPLNKEQRFRATVVGVYASSGPTRKAAFVAPGAFTEAFAASYVAGSPDQEPALYSDVFFGTRGPNEKAAAAKVEEVGQSNSELLIEPRATKAARVRRDAAELVGPAADRLIPGLAGLVLIVVLLREQHHRLRRRRQEMGLLVSFGFGPGAVRRMVVGETVLEAAIGGVLAIPLGRWLLAEQFQLYLPREAVTAMRVDLIVVLALVAVLGLIQVRWLMARYALKDLIEGER